MADPQNKDAHRPALVDAFEKVARDYSTAVVLLHASVADRLGLGPSDVKSLSLVSERGRVTAGDLARETGLRTASVTALIDRLERKGLVQRRPDDRDRRKVWIEPVSGATGALDPIFRDLRNLTEAQLEPYSEKEIKLIQDYLARTAALIHEHHRTR